MWLCHRQSTSRAGRSSGTAPASPLPRACRCGSWSGSWRLHSSLRRSPLPTIVLAWPSSDAASQGRGDTKSASRFGDIVAVCDATRARTAAAAKEFTKGEQSPGAVHRLPQGAGAEGRQHHRPRDAGSLAHAHQPRRRFCQEGHLRREAADADHRRGQADGQGRAQAAASCCRPARSSAATSFSAWRASSCATGASESSRRSRCTFPPACARARSRPCRCPTAFTGTSGLARRRRWTTSRSAATRTSAGGSITPEARSPTGARITTTSRAGPSGSTALWPSRRARRSSRFPAATPRRRSSRPR